MSKLRSKRSIISHVTLMMTSASGGGQREGAPGAILAPTERGSHEIPWLTEQRHIVWGGRVDPIETSSNGGP